MGSLYLFEYFSIWSNKGFIFVQLHIAGEVEFVCGRLMVNNYNWIWYMLKCDYRSELKRELSRAEEAILSLDTS